MRRGVERENGARHYDTEPAAVDHALEGWGGGLQQQSTHAAPTAAGVRVLHQGGLCTTAAQPDSISEGEPASLPISVGRCDQSVIRDRTQDSANEAAARHDNDDDVADDDRDEHVARVDDDASVGQ